MWRRGRSAVCQITIGIRSSSSAVIDLFGLSCFEERFWFCASNNPNLVQWKNVKPTFITSYVVTVHTRNTNEVFRESKRGHLGYISNHMWSNFEGEFSTIALDTHHSFSRLQEQNMSFFIFKVTPHMSLLCVICSVIVKVTKILMQEIGFISLIGYCTSVK